MKRYLSNQPSHRIGFSTAALLLLLVSAGCGSNGNPAGSSGLTCQVITGNTTTSFSAAGGSGSISVRAPATCAWGAVSNAAFLTITQGASGTGEGSIQFSVAANTGAARTATLMVTDSETTVADTAIVISQSAP